jgi:hypothetical protein
MMKARPQRGVVQPPLQPPQYDVGLHGKLQVFLPYWSVMVLNFLFHSDWV